MIKNKIINEPIRSKIFKKSKEQIQGTPVTVNAKEH